MTACVDNSVMVDKSVGDDRVRRSSERDPSRPDAAKATSTPGIAVTWARTAAKSAGSAKSNVKNSGKDSGFVAVTRSGALSYICLNLA